MAFESLTDKLQNVFKNLRSKGKGIELFNVGGNNILHGIKSGTVQRNRRSQGSAAAAQGSAPFRGKPVQFFFPSAVQAGKYIWIFSVDYQCFQFKNPAYQPVGKARSDWYKSFNICISSVFSLA